MNLQLKVERKVNIGGYRRKRTYRSGMIYFTLLIISIFTIIPFIWSVSMALKGANDPIFSMPPEVIPHHLTFQNFIDVWTTIPIPKYLLNSLILTVFGVLLPLILCSMAAFPLARMKFKGRQFIFILILSTMMIPGEITMIPVYLIIQKMGLIGNFLGVILPGALSPFGVFLMRQAFMNIPREIEESAVIDGANVWRIFWHIMLPMVKPMLGVLAILSFISAWNSFLWPLLILQDQSLYPLTVGLYKLQGAFVADPRLIAAGAIVALVPVIVVFVWLQKSFLEAAYSSSVKG